MLKQIASRGALALACALQLGLAGCQSNPPSAPPAKLSNGAVAVPQSQIDQMKSLPPDQRQRMLDQMKGTPQYDQIKQAVEGSSSSSAGGGQPAPAGGGQ